MDVNPEVQERFEEQVRNLAVPVYKGLTVHAAHGKKRISRIDIGPISGGDSHKSFDCDLLVMAVGFKPQVNLLSMGRKRPEWDAERQILRVTDLPSRNVFHRRSSWISRIFTFIQRRNQNRKSCCKEKISREFQTL